MATPISISYPIKKSNDGFFNRTYTSLDTYASNINILLHTIEGEVPFDLNFGLPLLSKLFNPNTASFKDYVITTLKEKIRTYIPDVTVNDIIVTTNGEKLYFEIFISIPTDPYTIHKISTGLM